jgi:hypothetical protein
LDRLPVLVLAFRSRRLQRLVAPKECEAEENQHCRPAPSHSFDPFHVFPSPWTVRRASFCDTRRLAFNTQKLLVGRLHRCCSRGTAVIES